MSIKSWLALGEWIGTACALGFFVVARARGHHTKVVDSVFSHDVQYPNVLTFLSCSAIGSCLAAWSDTKLRGMLDVTVGSKQEHEMVCSLSSALSVWSRWLMLFFLSFCFSPPCPAPHSLVLRALGAALCVLWLPWERQFDTRHWQPSEAGCYIQTAPGLSSMAAPTCPRLACLLIWQS